MTSSPFRIQDFWSVATPGTTLCLLDGTYRGSGNMISPPSLSGTSTDPITIRALNDGKVLIDGEFTRNPIGLAGVQWLDIEGINFRNGAGSVIFVSAGSRNVNFRRVVAWDANMTRNVHVVLVTGSDRIRFFDAGFFGTGRKVWSPSMKDTTNTECHRCWIRWEGSNNAGPLAATMQYNSYGAKLIDSLVTWDAISMPQNYCVTDANGNCTGKMLSNFASSSPIGFHIANDHSPNSCSGARLQGVLAYTTAKQHINVSTNYRSIRFGPAGSGSIGFSDITCSRLDHVAVVISPNNPWKGGAYLLSELDGLTTDKIGRHITAIAAGSNVFGANWDVPSGSRFIATSIPPVGSAAHPWTQSGTAGANLCYRYGTTTPMWPFPMNERIRQATAIAGAYKGPCVQCSGTMPRTRTATDVTAEVEALLGPIPATCRTDR
jgi:hypothetical protein